MATAGALQAGQAVVAVVISAALLMIVHSAFMCRILSGVLEVERQPQNFSPYPGRRLALRAAELVNLLDKAVPAPQATALGAVDQLPVGNRLRHGSPLYNAGLMGSPLIGPYRRGNLVHVEGVEPPVFTTKGSSSTDCRRRH